MTDMLAEKKRLTYAEFAVIQSQPENADKILELVDGEISQKSSYFMPSVFAARLGAFIGVFLLTNRFGYVTGEAGGYILSDKYTFNPDVGYIAKARLPQTPAREVSVTPDLAVEIMSPTDSKRKLREKAEIYLRYGTRLVWLVFPSEQRAGVVRAKS